MNHPAGTRDRAKFQPTEITGSATDFVMEDHSETFAKAVAELGEQIPAVDLADVLDDVNRIAEAPCGTPPTPDSVQFCWSDEDNDGTTWIPQGLTGSWDADAGGLAGGRRVIAATWYDREGLDGTNRGSRITFVDHDDPDRPAYRHVLLVVPDREGSFHAAVSHAGGVAWVGHRLFVADTDAIRVFDPRVIWRAEADSTHRRIGLHDGRAYAADYRYAIPQVGYYRPTPHTPLRISCIALDRTSAPHSLITAEFKEDRDGVESPRPAGARIVRWDLGDDGKPAGSGGEVRSSAAYVTSRANVNGAITHRDEFVLTSSEFDRRPGWIHRARLGTSQRYTSIPAGGPEDLTYQPEGDRMWTLTEYDGRRTVFGIPLSSIGS